MSATAFKSTIIEDVLIRTAPTTTFAIASLCDLFECACTAPVHTDGAKKRIRRGYVNGRGSVRAGLPVLFQHQPWKDELSPRPFACSHYGSGEEQTRGSPRIDCRDGG